MLPLFQRAISFELTSKLKSQLSQLFFPSFSYLNSAQHNSVIELCRALKQFGFLIRLCSKFTYSFVAIELLDFSIMQNSIFITQERSRYLGLKYIYTPYVKRIDFFSFCLYKNVAQKNLFVYKCK